MLPICWWQDPPRDGRNSLSAAHWEEAAGGWFPGRPSVKCLAGILTHPQWRPGESAAAQGSAFGGSGTDCGSADCSGLVAEELQNAEKCGPGLHHAKCFDDALGAARCAVSDAGAKSGIF